MYGARCEDWLRVHKMGIKTDGEGRKADALNERELRSHRRRRQNPAGQTNTENCFNSAH